jgi:isochorismate synthase
LSVEDVLPAEAWQAVVLSLVEDMREDDLEKVVLARECRVRGRRPFHPSRVLDRLRADYPGCFVFAVARGQRCFLGASPERLVRLRDGAVSATCLAGSIARGATPEEDAQLGAALLASAKDRAEHAIVVRALCDALAGAGVALGPVGPPDLMKVRNVQHLCTPVIGRVGGGRTTLELVERLHPTPAVGGYPREAALRLIREREGMDRGWYAGPVGWMDAGGEGELTVAIRSALLRGPEASLFAGCGIVAGSDPEREYAESCLKLRPMLAALEASVRWR